MKDFVSIIIPYYKKKKFIFETITSVLNQTYSNIEILIIYDDEDKTELEFLRHNFKTNKKVKIIINEKNLGAGLSRNKGINLSLGNYVAFVDADDVWKKNKLEKQLEFMKMNKAKISHTSYSIINEKNEKIAFRKARNFKNYQELMKSCDIGLSSVIAEKSLFNEEVLFVNLNTKEDFVLWLSILKKNIWIFGLDQDLLYWRKTKNSLSSSIIQKLIDGYRVYRVYMKLGIISSLYYLFLLSINYLKK